MTESVILSSPDGSDSLPTIWDTKEQIRHRGHILLQSVSPATPAHSRDALSAISSITGDDRLHVSAGLENTVIGLENTVTARLGRSGNTPRKPDNIPRLVTRVGIPNKDGEISWISDNRLLPGRNKAQYAFVLDKLTTHVNHNRQIVNTIKHLCNDEFSLQNQWWPESEPFDIAEVEFMGYYANSTSKHKRLEEMITIEYRPRVPLEPEPPSRSSLSDAHRKRHPQRRGWVWIEVVPNTKRIGRDYVHGNKGHHQSNYEGTLSTGDTTGRIWQKSPTMVPKRQIKGDLVPIDDVVFIQGRFSKES